MLKKEALRMLAVLATCFFSCSGIANAQTTDRSFVGFGFVGPALTQYDGDGIQGYNKIGIHAGVGVRRMLSERWGAQLELAYYQKGARLRNDPEFVFPGNTIQRLRLNYIEVALLAHARFSKRIGVQFGVVPAYLASASTLYYDGSEVKPETRYKTVDLGLAAGPEYKLGGRWAVNARWTYSLLYTEKGFTGFSYTNQRTARPAFNNALSFTLRYGIE